jgi:hypothetical protein
MAGVPAEMALRWDDRMVLYLARGFPVAVRKAVGPVGRAHEA